MSVDNRTFLQEGGQFGSPWDQKEQADIKPVICDICLKIFTSQHEFVAHINSHYITPNNKETMERDIKGIYHTSDSTTVKYEPQDTTSTMQLSQEIVNTKDQDKKTSMDVSEMLLEETARDTMKLVKKLEYAETSPVTATDATRVGRLKKKKKKKKHKNKKHKRHSSSSIKRKSRNKNGDKAKKTKSILVENGTMQNGSLESSQQDVFYMEDEFFYDAKDFETTASESSGDEEWLPASTKRHKKHKKGAIPYRRKSDIKPLAKCQGNSEQFHPGDELYVCEQCNKAFKTMSALQNHLVGHDGSRVFQCTKCSKAFKRKQILEQHELRHSTERPFRCDHCGRGFKVKVDLSYHLLTHTDAELHRCLQCGRGFKRKQDLTRHFAVHTDYRPYACTRCEYKFKRKMDLVQHLEVHNKKRHTCNNCGNMFRRKDSLTKHVQLYCVYTKDKVVKKEASSRGAES